MKLGIIVQTEPCAYQDFGTAYEIACAAIRKGHEVRMFLYDEAVIAANKGMKMIGKRQVKKMIEELIEKKASIAACGACCMFRGITSEMLSKGVEMGGLTDLADTIGWADKIVNLAH
jgi:tRNA 2-thiouridine synthesizing protein D